MDVALIFNIAHEFSAVLIVDEGIFLVRKEGVFGLGQKIKYGSIFKVNVDVSTFLFHFLNFVYVEGVEEHFFFLGKCLGCKLIFIDVDKTVVVFIPFYR